MDIAVNKDNQHWKVHNEYQLFKANNGYTIQLGAKNIPVFLNQKETFELTRDTWELDDFIVDKDGEQWVVTKDEISKLVNTLDTCIKNLKEYVEGLYDAIDAAQTPEDIELIIFSKPSFETIVGFAPILDYYTKSEMDIELGVKISSIVAGDNITISVVDPLNPIISSTGGGVVTLPNGMSKVNTPAEFKTAIEDSLIHTIVCIGSFTLTDQTYTVAGNSTKGKLIYGEALTIAGTTTFNGTPMSIMFKTDVTATSSAQITGVSNMKIKFRKLFLSTNIIATTIICHYELVIAGSYTLTGITQNYWDSSNITGDYERFTQNFKFSRVGFLSGQYTPANTYADLPYTIWTEDSVTMTHSTRGLRCGTSATVTSITIQFASMSDTVIVYIKKNGISTDLGSVLSATKWASFNLSGYNISAGDEILIGFYSSTVGTYSYPTATVFTREV